MRSETIRVKKPAWVRIVNPDPITILDTTWSYGSVVMLKPGGVLHILTRCGPRVLAMYQAPCPPHGAFDCPSDALLFHTPGDLHLASRGLIHLDDVAPPHGVKLPFRRLDLEPLEPERAGPAKVAVGDVARIAGPLVAECMVNVRARRVTCGSGPYRQSEATLVPKWSWSIERVTLDRGGFLTAAAVFSGYVDAAYRAPDARPPLYVIPADGLFRLREEEFLALEESYRLVREEDELRLAVVISLLRSL